MPNKRQKRLDDVNQITQTIASCGRKFFYHEGRVARMEIDHRGRVWWLDEYTQKRIYTHYHYEWRGFSHGGTMKSLVENFRDYVVKNKPLPKHVFGPYPKWYCNGDLWGYGNDMEIVRAKAKELGFID